MRMSEWAITRTLRSKGLSQKEAEESGSVAEKSRRLVFSPPKRSAGTASRFGRLSA